MTDLQKCLLDMLKEFVRVCDENNLTYYVVGGTCLGAIRHHGFIPWDDDIDVGLPREDYEKFLKLQSSFKEGYFIQTYKSDKHYIYNYAKVRDSRTTFIENFFHTCKMNHGVWIDVFPLDGMSNKMKESKKLAYKVKRTWWDAWMCYPPCLRRKMHLKTLWKDIPCNLVSYLFWPLNAFHFRNKLTDKRLSRIPYNTAVMVGNMCGANMSKEAMPREIFGEGTLVPFEDIMVKCPQDYDKYLTRLYGNYMKLPPIEKQAGHHHDKGFSLTQDYVSYIKEHKS